MKYKLIHGAARKKWVSTVVSTNFIHPKKNPFIISVRMKSTEMKSCNIPFQREKTVSKISHRVCDENFLSLACYTEKIKVWSNNLCLKNQSCGYFFWTLEVSHRFFPQTFCRRASGCCGWRHMLQHPGGPPIPVLYVKSRGKSHLCSSRGCC